MAENADFSGFLFNEQEHVPLSNMLLGETMVFMLRCGEHNADTCLPALALYRELNAAGLPTNITAQFSLLLYHNEDVIKRASYHA